ncbi:MAG TPA: 5-oxoprolinase subunit PxpB [Flavisolibacter sp.]|nr:5-oxoprolinase subunit PxpB [Flavisolibacter sp.]
MKQDYTISLLGDSALLIHFGNRLDDGISKKVLRIFHQLKQLSIAGVTDIVPAYSSLAVYYDVMPLYRRDEPAVEVIRQKIEAVLQGDMAGTPLKSRKMSIPVCYEKKYAPDLEAVAGIKSLSAEEVIQLHVKRRYRVYMIGFLPGFAYMGKVDEAIAAPRKKTPVKVVAGSVGIAGGQTGIYPFTSPGGWNIIGRTPIKLFDKEKNEPVLLQPGDEILFYSITEDEFENYQDRLA